MSHTSKSVNDFITDIYGTVPDANQWPEVMQRTAWEAGAKASTICLVDYVAEEVNSQFMCPMTQRMSASYAQNPHMGSELKALSMLPQVLTSTEFFHTDDYLRRANELLVGEPLDNSQVEDWLRDEWGIGSGYLCRLNIQPSYLDVCTILFGDKSREYSDASIQKIQLLTPHFAKAVELSRPFLLLKSRFQATLDVLDRFQLGVFILSSDGQVAMRNAAADRLLELADAVSINASGRLKSRQTEESPDIGAVVADMLHKQLRGDVKESTEVILQRRSLASPYIAELSPLSGSSVIGRPSGLMVIMIDPEHKRIVSINGMQKMFGLTKAENNICQLLVEGLSTNEIADTRNVSPITVKNQIKSLLGKTGNHNRSDLIRQALNINLPIDQKETAA